MTPCQASKGNIDIIHLLIEAGAKSNIKDKTGSTPLHRAASTGKTEAVSALLERGKAKWVNLCIVFGLPEITDKYSNLYAYSQISHILSNEYIGWRMPITWARCACILILCPSLSFQRTFLLHAPDTTFCCSREWEYTDGAVHGYQGRWFGGILGKFFNPSGIFPVHTWVFLCVYEYVLRQRIKRAKHHFRSLILLLRLLFRASGAWKRAAQTRAWLNDKCQLALYPG